MNLNSVLIGSANPQALREYYAKVFGKPVFEEGDANSTNSRPPEQRW